MHRHMALNQTRHQSLRDPQVHQRGGPGVVVGGGVADRPAEKSVSAM